MKSKKNFFIDIVCSQQANKLSFAFGLTDTISEREFSKLSWGYGDTVETRLP
jgi:hypothetical protein